MIDARRTRLESGLTVISDAPHGFLNQQQWFDEMIDAADAFFAKGLSVN